MARLLKVLLLAALALMIGSLRSSIGPSTPENLEIGEPAPGDDMGRIHAIEAAATGEVWVVGETLSTPTKGLVAQWDGTEWKNKVFLSVAEGDHSLHDIAILSPNDMWAVGESDVDSKTSRALIAHSDGTEWKVVTGAETGPGGSGLRAIAAVAPDDIWVAGWSYQEGRSPKKQVLMLHWNGKNWRSVPAPTNAVGDINDIDAVSAQNLWVVARDSIFHWDGESWSESHNVDDHYKSIMTYNLMGVEALSEQDVWVVGYSIYSGGCDHGTVHILHWDGYAWSSVPTPAVGFACVGSPRLVDIHALAPDDIWAVGDGLNRPMAMHWDGRAWSLNACPDVGLADWQSSTGLVGVTGAKGKIWVAGSRIIMRSGLPTSSGVAFPMQPFIMHPYRGACPTPTPWPTPIPEPTRFVPPTLPEVPGPVRTDIPRPVQTGEVPWEVPGAVETVMSANRTPTMPESTRTRPIPLPSPTAPVP